MPKHRPPIYLTRIINDKWAIHVPIKPFPVFKAILLAFLHFSATILCIYMYFMAPAHVSLVNFAKVIVTFNLLATCIFVLLTKGPIPALGCLLLLATLVKGMDTL